MAYDQIEYCGGCPHYKKCKMEHCVYNSEDSKKENGKK